MRGHEQKCRALAFFCKAGQRRDLRVARSPFLDMGNGKAKPHKHVDVSRNCAVLFDDALGEPIRRARAFGEIAIDRPCLVSRRIDDPTRRRRRGIDRMLDGKEDAPPGRSACATSPINRSSPSR